MTSLTDIAQIILAVFAIIGAVVAVAAWFYKRGGHERALANALEDNTKSNREVSAELRDFKGETLAALRDHDWRLKILEGQ